MTLVMSELGEQMTDLTEALRIPQEREMPRAAMEAQRRMLVAVVAQAGSEGALPLAKRLKSQLRSLATRLGLLALLCAICAIGGTAAMAGKPGERVAALTAATGATAIAAAAFRAPQAAVADRSVGVLKLASLRAS